MNKDLITVLLVDGIALFIVLYTALTSSLMLRDKNKSNVLLKIMLYIFYIIMILMKKKIFLIK